MDRAAAALTTPFLPSDEGSLQQQRVGRLLRLGGDRMGLHPRN